MLLHHPNSMSIVALLRGWGRYSGEKLMLDRIIFQCGCLNSYSALIFRVNWIYFSLCQAEDLKEEWLGGRVLLRVPNSSATRLAQGCTKTWSSKGSHCPRTRSFSTTAAPQEGTPEWTLSRTTMINSTSRIQSRRQSASKVCLSCNLWLFLKRKWKILTL